MHLKGCPGEAVHDRGERNLSHLDRNMLHPAGHHPPEEHTSASKGKGFSHHLCAPFAAKAAHRPSSVLQVQDCRLGPAPRCLG